MTIPRGVREDLKAMMEKGVLRKQGDTSPKPEIEKNETH